MLKCYKSFIEVLPTYICRTRIMFENESESSFYSVNYRDAVLIPLTSFVTAESHILMSLVCGWTG